MDTSKLSAVNQNIISEAIDCVMEKYEENNKVIFKNESDRAEKHFGLLSNNLRAWKTSQDCIVPACSQKSIKKSHTIPRGMLVDAVAENGHVLSPEYSQTIGAPIMKSLSVNIASTFPGFCQEHENLFEEFENNKKLESERHVFLQTYRSACRESFRSSLLVKQNKTMISSYCQLRDECLKDQIQEEAISRGFPSDATFNSIKITKDPIVEYSDEHISGVNTLSEHVKERILPALENAVFNGCDDSIFSYAINIDLPFPAALSGCAPYYVDDNGKQKQVYLIMNIVPHKDSTLFIFAGHIDNKKYIENYISKWTINIFTLISMAESWMVNGSDQWYLKPSIWNSIPNERKKIILTDMIECKQNIGEEYNLSIFDDMRTKMLEALEKQETDTTNKEYLECVKLQTKKMI